MSRAWLAMAVGVLALGAAGVSWWVSTRPPQPNVLIILWDTVRADRMSMYGYDLPTTPRMDAWARESAVVYEHAVSPAMWTVPSHASLFTGLAPTTHGAGTSHRWLDDHNLTLAEHFTAHGYQTYAFTANPNLSPNRVNLLQGFEVIDASWARPWRRRVVRHTKRKLLPRDVSTEISRGRPNHNRVPGYYNAGPITREAFGAFLDQRAERQEERPFFAYLSYMEAHKPRVPRMASRRTVADDATVELGLGTDLTFKSQLLYSYGLKTYTDEELEAVNRVYDATLLELDDATADLLDDLKARGVLDDTIVVFTSDHGEQLGEHQQFGHRSTVYQQLLHVPLVIAYPRTLDPDRVATRVTNLDLYHTIIELARLPLPEGSRHKRGDLSRVRDLVAQTLFAETISVDKLGFGKVRKAHPELTRDMWANLYKAAVGADGMKLIHTLDHDSGDVVNVELYDLTVDPFEEHEISAAHPQRVQELQRELELIRGALPPWKPEDADAEPEGPVEPRSAEECRMLETLGYVEEGCEWFESE